MSFKLILLLCYFLKFVESSELKVECLTTVINVQKNKTFEACGTWNCTEVAAKESGESDEKKAKPPTCTLLGGPRTFVRCITDSSKVEEICGLFECVIKTPVLNTKFCILKSEGKPDEDSDEDSNIFQKFWSKTKMAVKKGIDEFEALFS